MPHIHFGKYFGTPKFSKQSSIHQVCQILLPPIFPLYGINFSQQEFYMELHCKLRAKARLHLSQVQYICTLQTEDTVPRYSEAMAEVMIINSSN